MKRSIISFQLSSSCAFFSSNIVQRANITSEWERMNERVVGIYALTLTESVLKWLCSLQKQPLFSLYQPNIRSSLEQFYLDFDAKFSHSLAICNIVPHLRSNIELKRRRPTATSCLIIQQRVGKERNFKQCLKWMAFWLCCLGVGSHKVNVVSLVAIASISQLILKSKWFAVHVVAPLDKMCTQLDFI